MKNISLSILTVVLLSSRGTYVYQSTATKPNFFEEKGDWEAGINNSLGQTGEVYAAYAFANNWAIGGAFSGYIYNRDSIFFQPIIQATLTNTRNVRPIMSISSMVPILPN